MLYYRKYLAQRKHTKLEASSPMLEIPNCGAQSSKSLTTGMSSDVLAALEAMRICPSLELEISAFLRYDCAISSTASSLPALDAILKIGLWQQLSG